MSVQKEGKQAAPSIEPARIALDVDVKRYAALIEGDTDSAKADAVPVECDSPPVKDKLGVGSGPASGAAYKACAAACWS